MNRIHNTASGLRWLPLSGLPPLPHHRQHDLLWREHSTLGERGSLAAESEKSEKVFSATRDSSEVRIVRWSTLQGIREGYRKWR